MVNIKTAVFQSNDYLLGCASLFVYIRHICSCGGIPRPAGVVPDGDGEVHGHDQAPAHGGDRGVHGAAPAQGREAGGVPVAGGEHGRRGDASPEPDPGAGGPSGAAREAQRRSGGPAPGQGQREQSTRGAAGDASSAGAWCGDLHAAGRWPRRRPRRRLHPMFACEGRLHRRSQGGLEGAGCASDRGACRLSRRSRVRHRRRRRGNVHGTRSPAVFQV